MVVSCSNINHYNGIIIENTSSSDVIIAIVLSEDFDKITDANDVSDYALKSQTIKSDEDTIFFVENGDYTIWYNYPDIWGVLTTDGETKIFELYNQNLSITINKREWEEK